MRVNAIFNYVFNMQILHERKNPAARTVSRRRDFLTKKGITTANPSYVLRKFFFPPLLYIVYQIFRLAQIFVGFFISLFFIAYISNESKCAAVNLYCAFHVCIFYLIACSIYFFVQKKDGFAVLLTFFVRQMEQKCNHSDNCSVCQNDNGSLN